MPLQAIANPNEPRVSVLADALYKALAPLDFGVVVNYADIKRVIFIDPQQSRGRAAALRAGKLLLKNDRKLLVNVRGIGYQIAQPNEHAQQSKRYAAFGQRRYRRALAIVAHTELDKLTPAERQQVEEQTNRMALTLALTKRIQKAKALPSREEIRLPSGKALVDALRRRGNKS